LKQVQNIVTKPRSHFREPMTYYRNFSVSRKIISLVPRPPPFICSDNTRKRKSVLYWTQTEEQKTGGGLGTRLQNYWARPWYN